MRWLQMLPALLAAPGTYPPAELRATLYAKNDNSREFNRALKGRLQMY